MFAENFTNLSFFDGKRSDFPSEKNFEVLEPRSGKVLCHCPIATPDQVDSSIRTAAAAQSKWAELTVLERGRVLKKVADIIRENLEEIAVWETRTNGKPIYEAKNDILSSADTFDFFASAAATVLQGDTLELQSGPQNRFAYTRREPFGVVGCIGAWNYPFQTCVWKVAPALAAGNAVVYKPSPFSCASPVLLGEILTAAGVPKNVYQVVQGDGSTGKALCEHPLIGKVSFTGSVETGRIVQQQSAVKPVTLELGGKSALILLEDTDVNDAVAAAMMANFLNQGQVCTNATRVFFHRSLLNTFIPALLKECEAKLIIGDPLDEKTRVGASINEGQLNRVLDFVESAKKEGGEILRGGKRVHPDGVEGGFYFDPAVVLRLKDDSRAVREEIFGAIMLLLPFDSEEEVIRRCNETSFGLAAGVFSRNLARCHRIANKLQVGTVFINSYNDADVNVPFGGYKNSGHGRENCAETLKAYTQVKAIYVNLEDKYTHCF